MDLYNKFEKAAETICDFLTKRSVAYADKIDEMSDTDIEMKYNKSADEIRRNAEKFRMAAEKSQMAKERHEIEKMRREMQIECQKMEDKQ